MMLRLRRIVLSAVLLGFAGIGAPAVQGQDTTGAARIAETSTYTVQDGDTLYSISRRFGIEVADLQRWNDLTGTQITPGQTLRVQPPRNQTGAEGPAADPPAGDTVVADPSAAPSPPEEATGDARSGAAVDSLPQTDTTARTAGDTVSAGPSPESVAGDTSATRVEAIRPAPYGETIVRPGDSFVSMALRTGTTADSLYSLNDSLTAPLAANSAMRLPRRFGPPTHVVQPGQTLYQIAGRYGVSVRALRSANDLAEAALSPGQRLRIPGRLGVQPSAPGTLSPPDTTGRVAVYPTPFAGRLTASGEAYDPDDFVGSHPSLPYGSVVLVTNPETGRSSFVRIVDRGPVEDDLLMDLSAAAAETLGIAAEGNSAVELRVVWIDR